MTPHIFRAYDIRGIVGKDFETKESELIGKAFGTLIQKWGGKRVVIGHDNRFTSDELTAYFTEGLLSTGCIVTHVGLSLTPMVHYAVTRYGFDAGVIVTASHNPKEYNGFRFDGQRAFPIFNQDIQEIRKIIEKKSFTRGEGQIRYLEIFEDYLQDITTRIFLQQSLKVVVDCGNGTASKFAPRILHGIGCEVFEIYTNLDGDYPHHTPDPENKLSMQDLAREVIKLKADVGFSYDTDADRFGVVDEKGKIYENDKMLIFLAQDVLQRRPGTTVIYDVKSSYILEQEIRKMGGKPEMIRTGHPYFKKRVLEDPNVLLGGELSSHTFIKDNYYGFDDGPYASCRVAEILSRSGISLSEYFDNIPKTAHTEELRAHCPDEQKFDIVEKLKKDFTQWELILIDGVRVKFSPTAWALIRVSNTMPALSLRFEAENDKKLKEIADIVKSRLQKYPVVDISCLSDLNYETD